MFSSSSDPVLDAYLESARRSYGDLASPNFSFVADFLQRNPYRNVVTHLGSFLSVRDMTTPDDDVCLTLDLRGAGEKWRLLLSMVGPYAMLMRVHVHRRRLRRSVDVTVGGTDGTEFEQRMVSLLVDAGFRVLTAADAAKPVRFIVPPDEEPEMGPLFRVLFTDMTELPWEYGI
jgi:hypothetical protein